VGISSPRVAGVVMRMSSQLMRGVSTIGAIPPPSCFHSSTLSSPASSPGFLEIGRCFHRYAGVGAAAVVHANSTLAWLKVSTARRRDIAG
jgi:hypothetical protein